MKNLITYTLAATLAAGATAHQHQHMHARRHHGSKVEKRAPAVVTEYVVGATETVYELSGKKIDLNAAKAGLSDGGLVVVGESNPTYDTPVETAAPQPKKASQPTKEVGAQFYESDSTEASAAPEPVYSAPAAKSQASKPKTSSPKKSGSSSGSSSSSGSYGTSQGTGLDKEFPSGKIDCSNFPDEYGAVGLDWLGLGGWSGIQYVPDFTLSAASIVKIVTGIHDDECTSGAMCSYACPAGYQKTQWPKAQGSDNESIGGLYCNSEGKLELTRKGYSTLCEPGVGGVSIQNDLDEEVVTCRTDYPGTENMVIPAVASAKGTVNVCNPEQDKYYIWKESGTSAQYYVNKKGYGVETACSWNSDGKDSGNWAPIVLGVGKAADGITYISIFQNLPTSTAKLNFNIEIKGDVNSKCSYINGKWTGGPSGCTTGLKSGGKATVRYF
ncbi:hypothetical protein ACHAPJ_000034 [Fusarium lateritium]